MNIEPKYVTFEQAKLLKGKEFEVKVRPMYYFEKTIYTGSYMYNTDGVLKLCSMPLVCLKSAWIDAPEQWQVVEWLRVNYGIWISVEGDSYGDYWYVKLTVCSEEVWEDLDKRPGINSAHRKFNNEHKSPQEAYSGAFDYILKELI